MGLLLILKINLPENKIWIKFGKYSSVVYFTHRWCFYYNPTKGYDSRYGWDSLFICATICVILAILLVNNERISKSKYFKQLFG